MTSVIQIGDHLQYPRVNIEAQGSLLAVARQYSRVERAHAYGQRGLVTDFSKGSRRRLIRQLARLAPARTTFLTLTEPDEDITPQQAKAHLWALLERIRRRYPDASAVWRMEFQKRGAVHFHLLVFNMPYLPFETLRTWWREILGHPDDEPLFVRIEFVRSQRGVMSYASKYVAKVADEKHLALLDDVTYLHAGRFWGVFNREKLPEAERVRTSVLQITPVAFRRIKQKLAEVWIGVDPADENGAVVFTDRAYLLYLELIEEALRDLPLGL